MSSISLVCESCSLFPRFHTSQFWGAFCRYRLFCRMSLSVVLSDVFLMIRLRLWVWVKRPQRRTALLITSGAPCCLQDFSLMRFTCITECLLGFSIATLLFLPFPTLLFEGKSKSNPCSRGKGGGTQGPSSAPWMWEQHYILFRILL